MDLGTIKKYDDYFQLNESFDGSTKNPRNRAFINCGVIKFQDGTSVTPQEIIDVFTKAYQRLSVECPKTFYFANKTLNIIFLPHSSIYRTMAVDKNMVMYINAGFVFHQLKMDPDLVGAVIMHEALHALFNHVNRGFNWLASKGRAKTAANWHDTNLAADVEVNQTLVKTSVITAERLVNEIHGIYLKNPNSYASRDVNVLTMEMILNNEELMNKLRNMCPPPIDPEKQPKETVKTSKEWDKGYKEGWNHIADLISKYGYERVWEMLQEAGLINSVGEIYKDKEISDIQSLEFLQVKSFDDYIKESLETGNNDKFKTYDDGYITAFGKLVQRIMQAIDGESGGGGGSGSGPEIDTDLKDNDLKKIDLPLPPSDSDDDNDDNDDSSKGLPENIKNTNKNSKSKPKSSDSSSGGDGDSGEENDEKDKESASNLAKDLEKKMKGKDQGGDGSESQGGEEYGPDGMKQSGDDGNKTTGSSSKSVGSGSENDEDGNVEKLGGGRTYSSESEEGVGGTGSFTDEVNEDVLRDAGYSDEDIDELNKIVKTASEKNSPERLQKVINDYRNSLDDGSSISKLLNAIDIESRKYMNIWEDILKKFLSKKTRRAGKDIKGGHNDWKNKKRIALGDYGIHRQKIAQDPQDVNIYVDVSGSIDTELLEIICKSLVILSEQNEYSSINVTPWASNIIGTHKVESMYNSSPDKVTEEILGYISLGRDKCGGGTESHALMSGFISGVEEILKDPEKQAKDDVHIVITDGYINGFQGIEKDMEDVLYKSFHRRDVASNAPKNTFWMLYDTDESYQEEWKKEIKNGTLIFIKSETVKNNNKK